MGWPPPESLAKHRERARRSEIPTNVDRPIYVQERTESFVPPIEVRIVESPNSERVMQFTPGEAAALVKALTDHLFEHYLKEI